jgi:hypothetical protein
MNPPYAEQPIRLDRPAGSPADQAPPGGTRATAATSDRHAARLVFPSAGVLIADSVRGISK